MQPKVQLSEVVYDPAERRFEALATIHHDTGRNRYACAVRAPLHTGFHEAAKLLVAEALRRHGRPTRRLETAPVARIRPAPVQKRLKQVLRRGLPEGMYGYFRGRPPAETRGTAA